MRTRLITLFTLFSISAPAQRADCPAWFDSRYENDSYLGVNMGLRYYGSTFVSAGFSFINEKYRRGGICMWSGHYSLKGIYAEFADDINSKTNSIHVGVWTSALLTVGLEANTVFTQSHVNFGLQPFFGFNYSMVNVLAGYNIQPITSEFNPGNRWTFLIRGNIPLFRLQPGGRKKVYEETP